jgi:hypothetical protein
LSGNVVGMDENAAPSRDEPDFRIYIERQGDRTDITHAVMDLFDIAHTSLDFGSGFLDDEEMAHLYEVGTAMGHKLDPADFKTSN